MRKKAHINQITVDSPCNVDWNSMIGNDAVRFCQHCNLSVHNLSAMTRKEATRLMRRSEGRLCVQYVRRPDGLIATRQGRRKLHQIQRRVSRIAAGAFTAALSVTTAAQQPAQQPTSLPRLQPANSEPDVQSLPTGTVSGTITDGNRRSISSATVALLSTSGFSLYTTANVAGEFRFEQVTPGSYIVRSEAPGFAATEDNIYIQPNGTRVINQELRAETLEGEAQEKEQFVITGGAVAIVIPKDPLIRAAQDDELEEVQNLLVGRDVNLRDHDSHTTALEHAVRNANREMVQLLVSAGADVNMKDAAGETVLMMLESETTSDLAWDLINAGAKVNEVDESGDTPLMEAASVNNLDVLKTLIDAGAKVNAKNKDGQTALMLAAEEGLINNVRALILAGADINARDSEGKNALTYATDSGHKPVIRLLKAQGSEVVEVEAEGQN